MKRLSLFILVACFFCSALQATPEQRKQDWVGGYTYSLKEFLTDFANGGRVEFYSYSAGKKKTGTRKTKKGKLKKTVTSTEWKVIHETDDMAQIGKIVRIILNNVVAEEMKTLDIGKSESIRRTETERNASKLLFQMSSNRRMSIYVFSDKIEIKRNGDILGAGSKSYWLSSSELPNELERFKH